MNMRNWKEFVSLVEGRGYDLAKDEPKIIELLHRYKKVIGR